MMILAPPRSREERVGEDPLVRQARHGPAMRSRCTDDPGQCGPDVCEDLARSYEFMTRRSLPDTMKESRSQLCIIHDLFVFFQSHGA